MAQEYQGRSHAGGVRGDEQGEGAFSGTDSEKLPVEMERFLIGFNSNTPIDPILRAAVAHLWFVTHPFEEGNGRISRAIADLQLARADGSPQRFYSMSAQIRQERQHYYSVLEKTQSGDLDITEWLTWFLECLGLQSMLWMWCWLR